MIVFSPAGTKILKSPDALNPYCWLDDQLLFHVLLAGSFGPTPPTFVDPCAKELGCSQCTSSVVFLIQKFRLSHPSSLLTLYEKLNVVST